MKNTTFIYFRDFKTDSKLVYDTMSLLIFTNKFTRFRGCWFCYDKTSMSKEKSKSMHFVSQQHQYQ